jgi:hypothetical protein
VEEQVRSVHDPLLTGIKDLTQELSPKKKKKKSFFIPNVKII